MIKITRDEFLTFSTIPDISNAKEVAWYKSDPEGDKLGIIIQTTSSHKYDYLLFEKEKEKEYILYPKEVAHLAANYEDVCEALMLHMGEAQA